VKRALRHCKPIRVNIWHGVSILAILAAILGLNGSKVSLLESGLIIETKVKPDSRRDMMIG
jgi:hypothetical protein